MILNLKKGQIMGFEK